MAIASDPILVTGAAGFIGYHVAETLCGKQRGHAFAIRYIALLEAESG